MADEFECVQVMYLDGDVARYDNVKSIKVHDDFLYLELINPVSTAVYNLSNIVGYFVVPKIEHEEKSEDGSDVKIISILDQK